MGYILSLLTSFMSNVSDINLGYTEYVSYRKSQWEVEYNIDPELWCLTENIYHESKGEPVEGKIGVAKVTLNRVNAKGFPNTICGVVYQPSANPNRPFACAFSWTCAKVKPTVKNFEKWDESARIASLMLYGIIDSEIKAKHYVRCGVRRSWMSKMYQSRRIHNHCYLRRRM